MHLPSNLWLRVFVAAVACMALTGRAAERQALKGHLPAVVSQLAPEGRLPAGQRLHLAIALPLRNADALAVLLRQLYDPASPNYRHFLTPAQFTAQFGPAGQDYEAVAAFAQAHGLTVTGRYPNRAILDVEGAVSDIEAALHVTMRTYRHPTEARTFYAPDAEPSLDLATPVLHIGGLDNYSTPTPNFHYTSASRAPGAKANTGSGPSGSYIGYDFRNAYAPGVTLTGSGQTLGLLEFDGYAAGDITSYESQAGLPNVPLTNVLLDSYNGQASGNGQVECSLDIEVAIAMAPGLSGVIIYDAGPSGNFDDILSRMVSDDSAKELSCSWYISGGTDDPVADGLFQQMAAQGQSFFCASGDSDAYTGLIPFPCDNPNVTEVGGTTLTDSATGGSWSSETAWNWGYDSAAHEYVGTGGGVSTQYTIPSWQQGISMTSSLGSTTMRNVPDVALTADNIDVRVNGGNQNVGGTSCAAPLWAGFTALVNQQAVANGKGTVGFINPAIYSLAAGSGYAADFHDIATGNDFSSASPSKFPAVSGYDLCTGLGTPAGAALINALVTPSESLAVSSVSFTSSGAAGGPFSPGAQGYALTNLGASPLGWSASATQSWLTLSATSGTLGASGSSTVTASINASANTLGAGSYSGTITFTDLGTGYAQTRPVSLTVIAAPVITGALSATATNGKAFHYQIAATNSPASYSAGGLPSGLSVNSSTGAISGTTTATGTDNVTISAVNVGGTGSATLVLTVLPPHPVITSSLTATATNGAAFSYQIVATNNPASYSASGLPAGLSVNTSTGLISGTTTATGADNVTINAVNTGGTGSATLALTVLPAHPVITSSLVATATSGIAFSYQIAGTNSPSGYGASGLPAGLGVNTATGLISGTATATGTSNVTISALNAGGTGAAILVLTVLPQPPAITSALTATAANGAAFTYQIAATNSPSSYGASGLPAGLGVNTSTGLISGTTTATGTANVTLSAANAGGAGTAQLALTVLPPPPVITSPVTATAGNGAAFTYQIAATNNPASYSAGGLPSGLALNATTGLISGTTTATGTASVILGAVNAGGTGSATLALTVTPPPPVISSPLTVATSVGLPFSYTITASNNPGSYNAAGLPAGLSVNTASGVISGTAAASGTTNATISATNPGGTGSATLTIAVQATPAPVITSALNAQATNGMAFAYQITATNNPASYGDTNVPAGLSLNTATGLISGTPTGIGKFAGAISATNPGGTATATLKITILPAGPIITSPLSVTGTNGSAFAYQITATGNPASYSASGLPAGLGIDTNAGLISGTLAATGTSSVALSAVNSSGTGSAVLVITSVQAPAPVITSGTSVTATAGAAFTYQIVAANGPTSYAATGLPPGFSISSSSGLVSGTWTATGANTVTISAANASGTGSASLTVFVETPYQAWLNQMFPSANLVFPAAGVDTATPAGDGIPNLMKYALNLNPFVNAASGLPASSVITTGSGNYLTLTYTRVISATDITYTVQVSTDLQTWNSGPAYTTQTSATNNPDGVTQSITVQDLTPVGGANPPEFMRLEVTGP